MSTEYEGLDLVFSHVYQVNHKKHLYNLLTLTINKKKTDAKNRFWTSCMSHMLLHTTPPQQKNAFKSFKFKNQIGPPFQKMPFRGTNSFRRWVLALALPAASRVAKPNYQPSTRAPTSRAHGRNVAKPVLGEPAERPGWRRSWKKKCLSFSLSSRLLFLEVKKATKGGLRLSWTDSSCCQSMLCGPCETDWQSSACSGTSCQNM